MRPPLFLFLSLPFSTMAKLTNFMNLVQILLLCQFANASVTRKLSVHPVAPTLKHIRGGAAASALSIGSKVIAGGASRAIAQALLYPVDALRTLAQTRDGRTLADVGAQALVRGCAQTSSFALFTGAFQFGIFGLVNPHYGPLVASACGAAGSCLVSVPQEVIKQRLITGVYSNFREAATTIWRTEGILGFYSAWKPTVSRNVPFVITTFTCRDIMHKQLKMMKQRRIRNQYDINNRLDLGMLDNLGIGIMSALVAGVITQPIDVIKTRMMTQAASKAVPYSSALDCALTVLRTEGWQKLYSGIGQRCIYMCGLWGLTFALEPMMTNYLNSR
jgi:solute carrier family 25 S-adenosylmethionine transporter 26